MAIITPTSWTSNEMDWTAPDAGNPSYIAAIYAAIIERSTLGFATGLNIWDGDIIPNMTYKVSWAKALADRIIALASDYVIINTDTDTRLDTPYLTVLEATHDDAQWADLAITTGDPITSAQTVKYLKAAKHFLDLITIVTATGSYPISQLTQYPLQMDCEAWDTGDLPDGYSKADAGSWASLLSTCVSCKTVTDVTENSDLGASLNYHSEMVADMDVQYQQNKPLGHNLILQCTAEEWDKGDIINGMTKYYYQRAWDWLGLGIGSGEFATVAVAKTDTQVQIGSSTIQSPSPALNYPYPPAVDGDPYYANTRYVGKYANLAYNFAVSDGFSFYTPEETEEE